MKILQINNCHYRRGGADVVYLNTGELLEQNGHEVIYFSQKSKNNIDGKANKYFVESIDFFNSSIFDRILSIPRFFYSKEVKHKINQLISDLNPDIAHIHTYKGTITSSILEILNKRKIPVIITLHDYGFLCPHNLLLNGKMEICERCISGSFINCIIHRCNRNSLSLSTVSAFEYAFQKSFFPFSKYFNTILAVSKFGQNLHNNSKLFLQEVKHLYNFFPNLRNTIPNSSAGDYFLFFGRLSKEKGILTLLNAWKKKKRLSKLKIIGTGELLDEIKEISEHIDGVEILGFRQGEDLINLIKNSSFVIVPSEWYENNPLSIIESYALGKPVIGSNVGGIPEIVVDGKTGFLFEFKSTEDLSSKISLAEKIDEQNYYTFSANARYFAENHFNPETHYIELIKIYENTILTLQNESR